MGDGHVEFTCQGMHGCFMAYTAEMTGRVATQVLPPVESPLHSAKCENGQVNQPMLSSFGRSSDFVEIR